MTLHNRDWEAMPKMCAFGRSGSGEPIFVNPVNVLYVGPGSAGVTIIYFAKDEKLLVAGELQHVTDRLSLAMNETA
jgi:hypothetical protein